MFFMFLISDKNVFYVVLLSHRCFFYKMVKLQEKNERNISCCVLILT